MYTGQFRFGRECRVCSDWECPIGQYRITCTPNSDSYCKPCTNKPSGQQYLTPGNDNDCKYGKRGSLNDGEVGGDSDPAVVATLDQHMDDDLARSEPVQEADWDDRGLAQRAAEAASRVVDPQA